MSKEFHPKQLLLGTLVGGTVVVIGGVLGLVAGAGSVPVLAFVSSAATTLGVLHMLLAVLGYRAVKIHSLLFLGIFFGCLCFLVLLELTFGGYGVYHFATLSDFLYVLLLPYWIQRLSTDPLAISNLQTSFLCCGFMDASDKPAPGCLTTYTSGCVGVLTSYYGQYLLYASVSLLIFGLAQIASFIFSWKLRNVFFRLIENAPLTIATDPLALDVGDTALSDVWEDKPLSKEVTTRKLLAAIPTKSTRKNVTYAPTSPDSRFSGGDNDAPSRGLWSVAGMRSVNSFGSHMLGGERVLIHSESDSYLGRPVRDDSDDDDDVDRFKSFGAKSRHTKTVYKFGY